MPLNNNTQVFLALVRAGLWEKEARLLPYGRVDYQEVMRLAEEQSVMGLVTAGLEHVADTTVPKVKLLQFIGETLQIEEQNKAMNNFIGVLMERLRKEGICAVLVKGQGIAQCYERPMWRSSGDVDLLLDKENYQKAKGFLSPQASHVNREGEYNLHQALTIDHWEVELHGTMRTDLGRRIDGGIDKVQEECFRSKEFRTWNNNGEEVPLPSPDNDVLFVFTHILQHFFRGGIGLRQICDWCRLLWTFRSNLNVPLLERRLREMGLMTEWKAFAAFSVNTLGMPEEAMPLYEQGSWFQGAGSKILAYIMETGNFGHNRDGSYHQKYPFLVYKAISLWQTTKDSIRHLFIFPKDSVRIWWIMLTSGLGRAIRGIT